MSEKQSIGDKFRQAMADRKSDKAAKLQAETDRVEAIRSGNIEPVEVAFKLEDGENAYAEFPARRFALVDHVVETTSGKTKKKGVVGRAVIGGVLLGPLGAIGGAATAGNKTNTTTTQKTVARLESVDQGLLILTDRRLIFVGSQVASLPFSDLMSVAFKKQMGGPRMQPKYEGMLRGEEFAIGGKNASDCELFYSGLTKN